MFLDFLEFFLPIVINLLLIILLIVGIILGVRLIKTINKVDRVVEDVNDKVQSLNGLFSIIDFTTDKIVSITDMITDGISGLIGKMFKRKNKNIESEVNEDE